MRTGDFVFAACFDRPAESPYYGNGGGYLASPAGSGSPGGALRVREPTAFCDVYLAAGRRSELASHSLFGQ